MWVQKNSPNSIKSTSLPLNIACRTSETENRIQKSTWIMPREQRNPPPGSDLTPPPDVLIPLLQDWNRLRILFGVGDIKHLSSESLFLFTDCKILNSGIASGGIFLKKLWHDGGIRSAFSWINRIVNVVTSKSPDKCWFTALHNRKQFQTLDSSECT